MCLEENEVQMFYIILWYQCILMQFKFFTVELVFLAVIIYNVNIGGKEIF